MEIILQLDGNEDDLKWEMSNHDDMARVLLGYYMFNEEMDDLITDPKVISWIKTGGTKNFVVAEIPDEVTDWRIEHHGYESSDSCWDNLFYVLDGKIYRILPWDLGGEGN